MGVTFADGLPQLYSEVKAVGFPQGGSTICVTKGVISRIDAHLYAFPAKCGVVSDTHNSPGNVLVLQIDAAINPGNSGGPTFNSEGNVVGVASSSMMKAQNVSYIIPVSVVMLFLNEVTCTGSWNGINELGVTLRNLESDSLRQYLKMLPDTTGALVDCVAPLGGAFGILQPCDVITHIDTYEVSNEGKVPIDIGHQKNFVPADTLVTAKPQGTPTKFTILRDGERMELEAVCKAIPSLMPRFHGHDCSPEYLIVGGLLLTRLTIPLKQEYSDAVNNMTYGSVIFRSVTWDTGLRAYKKNLEHDVVILLRILEHDINIGCPSQVRVLESVNGIETCGLRSAASLVATALRGNDEFIRFRFKRDCGDDESCVPDIVLERARIAAADEEISQRNRIDALVSNGLKEFFTHP